MQLVGKLGNINSKTYIRGLRNMMANMKQFDIANFPTEKVEKNNCKGNLFFVRCEDGR